MQFQYKRSRSGVSSRQPKSSQGGAWHVFGMVGKAANAQCHQ
jgi:hypothetical protein